MAICQSNFERSAIESVSGTTARSGQTRDALAAIDAAVVQHHRMPLAHANRRVGQTRMQDMQPSHSAASKRSE